MDEAATPFVVGLLFLARCLIPLVVLLGISYVLKRLGLIREPLEPKNRNNFKIRSNDEENNMAPSDV